MAYTDPAREFADTCIKLSNRGAKPNERGDVVLANILHIEAWSTEFLELIAIFSRRGDELIQLIDRMDLDDDNHRAELTGYVKQLQRFVSPGGLQNNWDHVVKTYLAPQYITPIKALSPSIKLIVSYPKIESADAADLLEKLETLLGWLSEHQLQEQDFIRQALIDGLERLLVRLKRLEWLGWGYTVESLGQVIAAYMALERGFPDPSAAPQAEAMLKKAGAVLKEVISRLEYVKKTVETGDWVLRGIGATTLLRHAPHAVALLSHLPS